MKYIPKDYESLLGVTGLSEALLKNHLTLYQGYVNNLNVLFEILENSEKTNATFPPEISEIKRRIGWEFNGMRLHEYYFENLSKEARPLGKNSPFLAKVKDNFGSYDKWEKDFKAIGMMRGIGWAILYLDKEGNLINVWISEHDTGHLAGAKPILVMDVFEHAYFSDYGLKRGEYIEAFFKSIDWAVVEDRLEF